MEIAEKTLKLNGNITVVCKQARLFLFKNCSYFAKQTANVFKQVV